MHQEPITQGVQPPCLAFSQMKLFLASFIENEITVPGRLSDKKYDNFLEVNAINMGDTFF